MGTAELENAWAAGLFEGEGTCYVEARDPKRSPRMSLKMTDMDVVYRFRDVVGSWVYGPYDPGPPRKPHWLWRAHGFEACMDLYSRFEPYLGGRRKARFQELLVGASFVDLCEPRVIDGGPKDLAWAAGFFEGEGCIYSQGGRWPELSACSTDEDPVRWLAEILGGRVYGPYLPRERRLDGRPRKYQWHWRLRGLRECFWAHGKLDPWLGERRRERFEEAVIAALKSIKDVPEGQLRWMTG